MFYPIEYRSIIKTDLVNTVHAKKIQQAK
jgi:hypothetical protein